MQQDRKRHLQLVESIEALATPSRRAEHRPDPRAVTAAAVVTAGLLGATFASQGAAALGFLTI